MGTSDTIAWCTRSLCPGGLIVHIFSPMEGCRYNLGVLRESTCSMSRTPHTQATTCQRDIRSSTRLWVPSGFQLSGRMENHPANFHMLTVKKGQRSICSQLVLTTSLPLSLPTATHTWQRNNEHLRLSASNFGRISHVVRSK